MDTDKPSLTVETILMSVPGVYNLFTTLHAPCTGSIFVVTDLFYYSHFEKKIKHRKSLPHGGLAVVCLLSKPIAT
jgi:hypothetical protein